MNKEYKRREINRRMTDTPIMKGIYAVIHAVSEWNEREVRITAMPFEDETTDVFIPASMGGYDKFEEVPITTAQAKRLRVLKQNLESVTEQFDLVPLDEEVTGMAYRLPVLLNYLLQANERTSNFPATSSSYDLLSEIFPVILAVQFPRRSNDELEIGERSIYTHSELLPIFLEITAQLAVQDTDYVVIQHDETASLVEGEVWRDFLETDDVVLASSDADGLYDVHMNYISMNKAEVKLIAPTDSSVRAKSDLSEYLARISECPAAWLHWAEQK